MSIDPLLKRILRDNRGQRLHVLIMLLAVPRPVMIREISETLNTSERTLSDLLPRMAADGYVCEISHRWTVTAKTRQLPLSGLMLASQSEETPTSGLALTSPASSARSEKTSDRSEIFSDRHVVVVDQTDPIDPDQSSTTNMPGKNLRSAAADHDLRAALDAARVHGKRRRQIIADPWCTAARFTGWYDHFAAIDAIDNPAGIAILRCLDHLDPPTDDLDNPAVPERHNIAAAWRNVISARG